jgi:hypothetical protein
VTLDEIRALLAANPVAEYDATAEAFRAFDPDDTGVMNLPQTQAIMQELSAVAGRGAIPRRTRCGRAPWTCCWRPPTLTGTASWTWGTCGSCSARAYDNAPAAGAAGTGR